MSVRFLLYFVPQVKIFVHRNIITSLTSIKKSRHGMSGLAGKD